MNTRIHEPCFKEIATLRELATGLEKIAAEKHPCSPLHMIELEHRLFPEIQIVGEESMRVLSLIAELDQVRAENEAIRQELVEAGVHVV